MRFGFQHLAPHAGHESTLLWFEHGGQTDCVLVDSGDGVDLDRHLAADDYLAAALVTHAHIDHYRTLGKNLRHGAPVYAAPGTAAALEHSLTEATKDNDVGDVESVLHALEGVEGWTTLVERPDFSVDAVPIPAGHAVGAAAFLVRIEDEPLDGPRYVLATGDFTRRPCAGNPGLTTDLPDLEAAFVNVATSESFEEVVSESVAAVMETALGGGRVVLATNGTTGVHYAYLLGHAAAALGRRLPVTVVGQVANLYEALDYDVPNVRTVPVFDQTAEVLEAGSVTIAGPEAPTKGSTVRLLGAVRDDPAALFAQVTTGGAGKVSGTTCTTRHFEVSNHPTDETLDAVVAELDPENVVVQHTRAVAKYRERYGRNFVWASDQSDRYALYADGEWLRPEWMSDYGIQQVEMQRYGDAGLAVGAEDVTPPSLERADPDLAAEGLDLARLRESFSVSGDRPASPWADDGDSEGADAAGAEGADSAGADAAGSVGADAAGSDGAEAAAEPAAAADAESAATSPDATDTATAGAGEEATVDARVLRGDEGVTLLQLLDDVSLSDGVRVRVSVAEATPDGGDVAEPSGDGAGDPPDGAAESGRAGDDESDSDDEQ